MCLGIVPGIRQELTVTILRIVRFLIQMHNGTTALDCVSWDDEWLSNGAVVQSIEAIQLRLNSYDVVRTLVHIVATSRAHAVVQEAMHACIAMLMGSNPKVCQVVNGECTYGQQLERRLACGCPAPRSNAASTSPFDRSGTAIFSR